MKRELTARQDVTRRLALLLLGFAYGLHVGRRRLSRRCTAGGCFLRSCERRPR